MKKKILFIITVSLLIMALAVPAAFAALTDAQKGELDNLYKQMTELRKKTVDIYVQSGDITEEQGKLIKDRIDQMYEYRKSQGFAFGKGFGSGCGRGRMGGFGSGFGSTGAQNQSTQLQ